MKINGLMIAALVGSMTPALHAQDTAPPSVDLYEQEAEQATPTPSRPPNGPELPDLTQLDETFKPPSLGVKGDDLKMRLEWRQLKNRTVNDPEVRAAKAYAQAAPTDLEKRHRLRNYYDVYYQRMSALAKTPQMKLDLEALKGNHQGILAQPRVRPTPDLSTPTPTPSGTPTPTPTPAKRKKKSRGLFGAVILPAHSRCGIPSCILVVARSSSG